MTTEEFNQKYEDYLEAGHYGLAINNPKVIEYLNKTFEDLITIPYFKYHQIKEKFGSARVYMEPRYIDTNEIEGEINKILESTNNQ